MAVVVVVGIVVVLGLIAMVTMRIRTRGRVRVDRKARLLGAGKALEPWTESGARQKAEDCGRRLGMDDPPGVVIGTAVAGRRRLYGSCEDLHVDIWGTRQGKTTCRTIPAILAATGPVIATSAKRDLVDATRDVRADNGRRCVARLSTAIRLLRLPRHCNDDHAAVLVAGCPLLGRRRHERAVVGRDRPNARQRRRRYALPQGPSRSPRSRHSHRRGSPLPSPRACHRLSVRRPARPHRNPTLVERSIRRRGGTIVGP